MTETVAKTTDKPSKTILIKETESGVAGIPPLYCDTECPPCHRVSLQCLVVTPSVVPIEHAKALKEAGHGWPTGSFDTAFAGIQREGTVPVVRIARAGYFVVINTARQTADIWRHAPDGLNRKIMNQVTAKEYADLQSQFTAGTEEKVCSRKAANVPGTLINIDRASDVAEVWIGYTPHLWLPSVFENFLLNKPGSRPGPDGKLVTKPVRELHGRTISPSGILGGQFQPGTMPINQLSLEGTVADFVKEATPAFKKAFELALKPLDAERIGLAETFEKSVRALERISSPKENPKLYDHTSFIVMVDDDLGVMEQHNNYRHAAAEAKKAWMAGAEGITDVVDPVRPWALRSSLHVDMVLRWEAAREAAAITERTRDTMHRRYGANVTKEQFDARQSQGGYPPGTTFEPSYEKAANPEVKSGKTDEEGYKLDADGNKIPVKVPSVQHRDGLTLKGRVRLPDEMVTTQANRNGAEKAEGMRSRLVRRIDMQQVSFFRSEFKAESERWDERIAKLDRDCIAFRNGPRFGATYLNQFARSIDLTEPNLALGSIGQQITDFANKLRAAEAAIGGGAITIDSAKDLARLYKLPPDNPLKWFDNAVSEAFNFTKAAFLDPGNRSEAAEGMVGIRAIKDSVAQILNSQLQQHNFESTLTSLLAARSQMVNLVAASIDAKTAEALGIAAVSRQEAQRAFRVHVKFGMLAEELVRTRPGERALRQYVFNIRVPAGMAIDEVRDAIAGRVMPASFEPRKETTRGENRRTFEQFRKLNGVIDDEVHFPVLLNKSQLEKLQKEAIAKGEDLVEILPDAQLGMKSGPIKVPKFVAQRLIQEQAVTARQAVLSTGEGKLLLSITSVQVWALWDTAYKMFTKEGIEQADAVLSTLSTSLAILETRSTLSLHVYTLRADGARTVTVDLASGMATARRAAGLFGAGASIVDAVLAFVRADNAYRSGDKSTGLAYGIASGLYTISGAATIASAFATYQAFAGTGLFVNSLGITGAAMMGAWLMSVGIVLSIVAFGFMLYALYTTYQSMDIFLDRSYWGLGNRAEGKFGKVTRRQLQDVANDRKLAINGKRNTLKHIAALGMKEEVDALQALPIGLQITFEWHKNWFSDEAVVFKVACGRWPKDHRKVTLKMEMLVATGAPGVVVFKEKVLALEGPKDRETGAYEFTQAWAMKDGEEDQYTKARVTYVIHGDNTGDVLTRGDMLVSRADES